MENKPGNNQHESWWQRNQRKVAVGLAVAVLGLCSLGTVSQVDAWSEAGLHTLSMGAEHTPRALIGISLDAHRVYASTVVCADNGTIRVDIWEAGFAPRGQFIAEHHIRTHPNSRCLRPQR